MSFRRDGRPVATPVWFVAHAGSFYARTDEASFKVRRIRREPRVLLAPCSRGGEELGERVPALARILPRSARPDLYRAILRRYGLTARVYDWYWRQLRGTRTVLLQLDVANPSSAGERGRRCVPGG